MNKKGQLAGGGHTGHVVQWGSGFILAIIVLIFALIFLAGGGAKTAFDIGAFFSKVPVVVWVILGIILIFRWRRK
jgi:hypothetical protein